ncbi:MAG: hypothetical protein HQL88_09145 [Magnetococcales bacterium]|nr:hypothetical protein [Magnetococcales bacterium]
MDPERQDEDVRFRTTYYMRIIDVCEETPIVKVAQKKLSTSKQLTAKEKKAAQKALRAAVPPTAKQTVLSDSLYRFRMTGKSGAMSTKVLFESGTLPKDVIDPLSDAGQKILSHTVEGRAGVVQSDAKGDVVAKNLAVDQATIKHLTIESITDSKGNPINLSALPAAKPQKSCPTGVALKRQFQLLGPHGYAPFDENKRLVMALSSDASPLIGSLTQLHEYKQGAGSEQAIVTKEQVTLFRAQSVAMEEMAYIGKRSPNPIEKILNSFNGAD